MTLTQVLHKVFLIEILKGLALTLRVFFRPPVTRQYPKEKRDPFPGFRGRHAFVRDPSTGREKCVACLKCANVCPSQCIHIDFTMNEDGGRVLAKYDIEALRCVYCGYCEEVCPVCAIILTEYYEYADVSRDKMYFDRERLLANWDEFAATVKGDSYTNKFWRPDGIDPQRLAVGKRNQKSVPVTRK